MGAERGARPDSRDCSGRRPVDPTKMSKPVSAEPTEIDLLPPTSGDAIERRLRRASVLITQAQVYGAHGSQALPMLRSARTHLAGTLDRLDELIGHAEARAEDESVPKAFDEQLTTAGRIARIDKNA
jgi:hypothetical protein